MALWYVTWVAGLALVAGAARADTACQIGVSKTGVYRVTGADLARAGLPLAGVDPRTVRLSCGGREVARILTGAADRRLDPTDALVFYGEALDTDYTDTNVYRLTYGGPFGRRMAVRAAAPPKAAGSPVRAVPVTTHLEENHLYGKLMYVADPAAVPHWFWCLAVAKEREDVRLAVEQVAPKSPARLVVSLFANTLSFSANPDHHARILWNGVRVADATWDGQTGHRVSAALPAGTLRSGDNTLSIECPGDTGAGDVDQSFLDWVDVAYTRRLVVTGQLGFGLPPGAPARAAYEVSGVGPQAMILDVTEPASPIRLEGVGAGKAAVRFAPRGAPGRRIFVGGSYLAPAWIRRDEPSRLRSPEQGADTLIVTADSLAAAVQPLAEWRRKQGMRVAVARVTDVYDEFGHGVFSPAAIREFVRYAYQSWQKPAPQFLLLVGDANYDYRDYLRKGVPNLVPTFLAPVRGSLAPATDSYFACVDDADHVPELAVGRLPTRTAEETAAVVAKILRYESSDAPPGPARALLVADHEGSGTAIGIYERSIQRLAESCGKAQVAAEVVGIREVDPRLPGNERAKRVRQALTPKLLDLLNGGGLLLAYHGHGNERYWSHQRVLRVEDVAGLKACPSPPLCVDITCFSGWFDKPDIPGGRCLAEGLLLAPSGGAIACVTPSRLGGLDLASPLITYLLAHRDTPIGAALLKARRGFLVSSDWNRWDAVETYNLLGDPALRLRWPK